MAAINLRTRRSKVRLMSARSIDDIPNQDGVMAEIGGKLYLHSNGAVYYFGEGTALERPVLTSGSEVKTTGLGIEIVFTENLVSPDNSPELGFSLFVDGVPHEITGGSITDNAVTLTTALILEGQYVKIRYSGGDLQTAAGMKVREIGLTPISNESTVPAVFLVSAAVGADGVSLVAEFSENLKSVTAEGFTVKVDGEEVEVGLATLLDDTITFTIPHVYVDQVVTLSYEDGNIESDATGAKMFNFSDETVTNNSEIEHLAIESLAVSTNGLDLVITFSVDVVTDGDDEAGFSVKVDDEDAEIASGTILDNVLTLRLANHVYAGSTVTISHAGGTHEAEVTGEPLESFEDADVANNSTVDPFVVESAAVSTDGASIVITLSDDVAADSDEEEGFTVEVDGESMAVTDGAIVDDVLTLTLDGRIYVDQEVKISYAGGSHESDNTGAPLAAFADLGVTNSSEVTPLAFVSAEVQADGETLVATFSEDVAKVGEDVLGFVVKVDNEEVAWSGAVITDDTISLTVPTVYPDQEVTLSYAEGNVVSDIDGYPLPEFEDATVENNSEAVEA